jgi:hypothetical protein
MSKKVKVEAPASWSVELKLTSFITGTQEPRGRGVNQKELVFLKNLSIIFFMCRLGVLFNSFVVVSEILER